MFSFRRFMIMMFNFGCLGWKLGVCSFSFWGGGTSWWAIRLLPRREESELSGVCIICL